MKEAGFALQVCLLTYLFVVQPSIGNARFERLKRDAGTTPGARTRFYWHSIQRDWGLVTILGLSLVLGEIPAGAVVRSQHAVGRLAVGLGWVTAGGIFATVVLSVIMALINPQARAIMQGQLRPLEVMLPQTRAERWQWAALSITAGCTEELLFRGIPFLLIPNPWVVLAVSAVGFGIAHRYQGWRGVIGTGSIGLVLALIYLGTGKLWVSVVLHALIDLRVLAVCRFGTTAEHLPPPGKSVGT